MKILRLMIFILLLPTAIYSQHYDCIKRIGQFSETTGFSITPSGFIYITDAGKNEIIKMDTLGNLIKSTGGYGWDPEAFDEPVDVLATTLNVYVADKNNNRIQMFDRDLNFLFDFNTQDNENAGISFAYPVSCGISNQGDFFILDSDNLRVLKYDPSGNFLTEFGGIDAGDFVLEEPKQLSVSSDGKIFVLDKQEIKIFDPFGSPLAKIKTRFDPDNINITFNYLTITDQKSAAIWDLSKPELKFTFPMLPEELSFSIIIEAALFKNKLYILTIDSLYILSKK